MLSSKEVQEVFDYWDAVVTHDYDTMMSLMKSKRYSDALFFGHMVLEKSLKALVTKKTKEHAPYTHNLIHLHESADIELSDTSIDLLADVNEFNMRARYPEQKLAFYKKCTKSYTEGYIKKISKLHKKLWENLK